MRLILLGFFPLFLSASINGEGDLAWNFCTGQKNPILIECTKALVLVDSQDEVLNVDQLQQIQDDGLYIQSKNVPGNSSTLKELLNPIYLDQPITQGVIKELKQAISLYYAQNGYPFLLITVPEQCISSNILQLVVAPSRLEEIRVEGNQHTSSSALLRNVHSKPGEILNTASIRQDLLFMNRHPFRRVDCVYSPGIETGTTDIVLSTEDRRPYRLYAGADNTGLYLNTRQRLFSGISVGKLFSDNQFFSYQYTTSDDLSSFHGQTGQITALLPWQHIFTLYGGYATNHPHLPYPSYQTSGKSAQASARYTIPFAFGYFLQLEPTLGFDYKMTNSATFFSEAYLPFNSHDVNLSQFLFQLLLGGDFKSAKFDFTSQLFWSPGELLPKETNADYSQLRPHATSTYVYAKGDLTYAQQMPIGFELFTQLRGQIATAALLPSEQYGLGGHATVRGYDENQVTYDNAINANVELRSPPIPMITRIRRFKMKDSLQFLAFFDWGWGMNKVAISGESSPNYLMSAGPGVRYTLDPYIAVRFDWGWKIQTHSHEGVPFTGGKSMAHFSVTSSY